MGGCAYLNCKYSAILYRGVEHLQILVSMGDPGTNSTQILRDDYMYFKNFCLFIYFWLCWVFIATRGLSLVVVSGGYSLVVVRGLRIAVWMTVHF